MDASEVDVERQIGEIGNILEAQEMKRGVLVQTLQKIQEDCGYLPEDVLKKLSRNLGIALSEIYSVASFYKMFHFKPRGRKVVKVCMGTACYVRGSKKVLNALENEFNVKSGDTTEDLEMTLETVGCVGCCGLAPVSSINEDVIGEIIGEKKVVNLIRVIKQE